MKLLLLAATLLALTGCASHVSAVIEGIKGDGAEPVPLLQQLDTQGCKVASVDVTKRQDGRQTRITCQSGGA